MNIGLFGGTFNPVHNAHVRLATTLRDALGLDQVWFMVTPLNPWKQQSQMLPDHHRLEMVRLAVSGIEGLFASDYEFHLPQPSYTYQTLRHLRCDYPQHTFTLLIGGDNWAAFDHWAEYEEILRYHRVAVYPRPGSELCTPSAIQHLGYAPHIVNAPEMNISSTYIRQCIVKRMPVDDMIPPAVSAYITAHALYSSP